MVVPEWLEVFLLLEGLELKIHKDKETSTARQVSKEASPCHWKTENMDL